MAAARSPPDARDERAPRDGAPAADETRQPPAEPPQPADPRIDALHAEAVQAVGYAGNTLRSIRERSRASYTDELARWQDLRDELDALERRPPDLRPR